MKNRLQTISHLISQGTLCWSPVAATRSEFSYTPSNNMIEAGKDYSRVREGWDG